MFVGGLRRLIIEFSSSGTESAQKPTVTLERKYNGNRMGVSVARFSDDSFHSMLVDSTALQVMKPLYRTQLRATLSVEMRNIAWWKNVKETDYDQR